ncbi:MAG: hypothetical protein IKK18_01730 [Clostridia bacterium]|nr:hypothetical protein [Clostridia bacterium]
MKKIQLLISATNLWIFGVFLYIYNEAFSQLLRKNSSLSKKHIVCISKSYEHYIEIWQKLERKHLVLISNFFST